MTYELEQAAVKEALRIFERKEESGHQIAITLAVQYALSIGMFLHTTQSKYLEALKITSLNNPEREQVDEDLLSVLITKFDRVIEEPLDPKAYLDITRREVDEIGKLLVEDIGKPHRNSRLLNKLRIPVYDSFLALDQQLVLSGGAKNPELVERVQGLLAKAKPNYGQK